MIDSTEPFFISAVAVAGIPQLVVGESMVISGAVVYPDPPSVTVILETFL